MNSYYSQEKNMEVLFLYPYQLGRGPKVLRQCRVSEKAVSNPSAPSLAAHVLANLEEIRTQQKSDPGAVVERYSFRKEGKIDTSNLYFLIR